jgi:ATP-dependent DNA ligase
LAEQLGAENRFRASTGFLHCDRLLALGDNVDDDFVAGGPRLATVDHIIGNGAALPEAGRQLGAEGIVSKRGGSPYRGGAGRDWLKTKVSEEGAFVITGYIEREALAVAERMTACWCRPGW